MFALKHVCVSLAQELAVSAFLDKSSLRHPPTIVMFMPELAHQSCVLISVVCTQNKGYLSLAANISCRMPSLFFLSVSPTFALSTTMQLAALVPKLTLKPPVAEKGLEGTE